MYCGRKSSLSPAGYYVLPANRINQKATDVQRS